MVMSQKIAYNDYGQTQNYGRKDAFRPKFNKWTDSGGRNQASSWGGDNWTDTNTDKQTDIGAWMQRMEEKYAKIRKHVKATCNQATNDDPVMSIIKSKNGRFKSKFLVDSKHHLAYCRHGKV